MTLTFSVNTMTIPSQNEMQKLNRGTSSTPNILKDPVENHPDKTLCKTTKSASEIFKAELENSVTKDSDRNKVSFLLNHSSRHSLKLNSKITITGFPTNSHCPLEVQYTHFSNESYSVINFKTSEKQPWVEHTSSKQSYKRTINTQPEKLSKRLKIERLKKSHERLPMEHSPRKLKGAEILCSLNGPCEFKA